MGVRTCSLIGLKSLASFFFLLYAFSLPGYAQTFGLKFGYPTANVFQLNGSDPLVTYGFSRRPVKIGLTGEIPIPAEFLLEIDALYSRLNYSATTIDFLIRSATTINAWDFPIVVKRPFTKFTVRPFVDAGIIFRAVNTDTDINGSSTTPDGGKIPTLELVHQLSAGLAAGVGIDFRIRRLHFLPEYRYAHFNRPNFRSPTGIFQSNLNQPAFLLGVQVGK
jgi:hypothetical protein